jgi:hypothetical protein
MSKFQLSREEFLLLPLRVSRWSKLLDKISKTKEPEHVPLAKKERTPNGRREAQKQIRALASRRGWRLSFRTVASGGFFVLYLGEQED